MKTKSLCNACGDGLIIDDFIYYLKKCEGCGNLRMCQGMVPE